MEWINSFSLGKILRATDELTDGIILWEILQDIDPQYFLDELPERSPSGHWVAKWQNLKHIHKLLVSYIRHKNDDELPPGLDPTPDLDAIAAKGSVRETNKLLKLLLIAAISSPNAETYVQTLQTLSTSTQEGLKDIIEEAQNGQHEPIDSENEDNEYPSKREIPVDLELQFEERVGKVLAENDRLTNEKKELEKALEDLHNRLARLQENNDTLQVRLASTEDRLVTLKSGKGDIGLSAKALETRTRQQEDLIASQEAKLAASQDEIDRLQMSLESLRVKNQRFQKLQDDYDELKTEREQLIRKANAAEKYRQKLQASQDFEKESQTLKNQIKDLQQQLKEADSQHRWAAERDVELEEYRRLLPHIEQDRHEIQNLKKQLEFNNHALTERLRDAEEQRERDDALISELRDRIRELEGLPGSPSPSSDMETPKLEGTLQKDFEDIGAKEPQLKPESEELKKGAELDAYPEDFVLTVQQVQTKSLQSEEYWKLYENYAALRKKFADAEDSLATTNRKLEDSLSELALVGKEKIDIIHEVKESNSTELTTMRNEWDAVIQKIHHLEAEADASHALAREVCIERDELRGILDSKQAEFNTENEESLKEMKALLAEFSALTNGDVSDTSQKSSVELLKQFAELTEKNIERLAKRAEYIEQQNEVIESLRERIKSYGDIENTVSKERELELQEVIEARDRELSLISSAWYDLQNRWRNNNITVSRYRRGPANGADTKKGWLAKQRGIVAGQ